MNQEALQDKAAIISEAELGKLGNSWGHSGFAHTVRLVRVTIPRVSIQFLGLLDVISTWTADAGGMVWRLDNRLLGYQVLSTPNEA